MPYRNMEDLTLRSIRWIEASNAAASVLLVLILCGACLLLDRQCRQLTALEEQLRQRNAQGEVSMRLSQERNEQGERANRLLEVAVRKLEGLQPPLEVHEQAPAR